MSKVARCPECGSTDLVEWNVSYSLSRVTRWVVEDGALTPADWDHEDPEWETDDEMGPYECKTCEKKLSLDELAIGEEDDDD